MLKVHIEPEWGSVAIADVSPERVDDWLTSLTITPSSKGRARKLLKQLIDRAMFLKLIPIAINPMTLVTVKGSTLRQKKIVLLTPKQVTSLVMALGEPYNVMVFVAASLGLRVEEVVALQWDFVVSELEMDSRPEAQYGLGDFRDALSNHEVFLPLLRPSR